MNRNGLHYWVVAAILAGLLIALYFSSQIPMFKSIYSFFGFFPDDFGEPISDGTSIVGVNLKDDQLQYYTGEEWRDINSKKNGELFPMGKYEFEPALFKKSIEDFYLYSERRPKALSISVNDWRYWVVEIGDFGYDNLNRYNLKIASHIKKRFKVKDLYNEPIYYNDKISDIVKVDYSFYVLAFQEYNKYKDKFVQAISWRDSILEDGNCERFLELNLDENKKGMGKKLYTVRKVGQYIFVDLSEPVYGVAVEKWKNESCFGVKNYVDDDIKITKEPEEIKFVFLRRSAHSFLERNKIEILKYSKEDNGVKNWRFSRGDQLNSIINSNRDLNLYVQVKYLDSIYKELNNKNFNEGFVLLTRPDDGLFWQNSVTFDSDKSVEGVYINGKKIDGWNELLKKIDGKEFNSVLNDSLRSEFTYKVLDNYYSSFKFEDSKEANVQ
ncbi:hypothetical protein J4423_05105 [Candidatus Pacearchaeota archaeon]|nr:hypothetical protein [Candidatus Pacearchaeota archaeon]